MWWEVCIFSSISMSPLVLLRSVMFCQVLVSQQARVCGSHFSAISPGWPQRVMINDHSAVRCIAHKVLERGKKSGPARKVTVCHEYATEKVKMQKCLLALSWNPRKHLLGLLRSSPALEQSDCYLFGGPLFKAWPQTCSKAARRPCIIHNKPWQNGKKIVWDL